jgi:[ribosomal protein S5]-alanine N-acetyltransferase
MLTLETERMWLMALERETLSLCISDPQRLSKELGILAAPEVFSEESRQAIGIKTTRMLLVDRSLYPWYTYFLLVQKSDRRVMGVCGFKGAPTPYGSVELGYAIHENFRSQGFMTEAVKALVAWAFTHDECKRVTAETLKDNFSSQRVLQKSGLVMDRSVENMLYWKIDKPGNSL